MTQKMTFVLTLAVLAAATTLTFAAAGGGGGGAGRGRGGAANPPATLPQEAPVILPKSIPADGRPQINGPRIASGNLNHIFLYKLPATGDAPLTFSADNLPAGLTLDAATGVITGTLKSPVAVATTFHVKNAKGEATRQVVVVVGEHKLALTPPLGWNSWNCWGTTVTDARVRAAADGFFNSGLVNHGFQYVNIDDGWEIQIRYGNNGRRNADGTPPAINNLADLRNADGTIKTNTKFPDMKGLGDYIHSKGLKFGIYSGPGPGTCGGYTASYEHEEQDAHSWASWGVDYIKYDWCHYTDVAPPATPADARTYRVDNTLTIAFDTLKTPYRTLRKALDAQDRDMVMSLCQYGWGNVWEWGAEDGINGNTWRATGDITDTWQSMSNIGFAQNGHEQYAGPGHWNDTDMLVVGMVGWGDRPRANRMTQNEQLTHITLWSILAAPMLLGCDLTQLDEFTTNLMSNDEMLAVNQDPAGRQGWRIAAMDLNGQPVVVAPPATATAPATGAATSTAPARGRGRGGANAQNAAPRQVWARPLWDGTFAVGLFNLDNAPGTVSIRMSDLAAGLKTTLNGPIPVRDIWQLKDLTPATDVLSAEVPRHGAVFLKVGTPRPDAACIADLVKVHAAK